MTNRSSRLIAVAAAVVLATSAFMVGTASAGVQTVVVTPGAGLPGSTVVISGTTNSDNGCDPGSTVNMYFNGSLFQAIGSTTTDSTTGDFSASVTIPASAELGPSSVGAQCVGGSGTIYVDFDVSSTATTTTTTTTTTTALPTTTTTPPATTTTTTSPTTTAAPASAAARGAGADRAVAPRGLALVG